MNAVRMESRQTARRWLELGTLGLVGWALCGATIAIGRRLISIQATLVVHAFVAPLVFGLLAWLYFRRFPRASPASTAFVLVGVVVGMDAVVVAPLLERSYEMFRSVLGTWIPFASILASTYLVGVATVGTHPPLRAE
jgi:hypothetical protein